MIDGKEAHYKLICISNVLLSITSSLRAFHSFTTHVDSVDDFSSWILTYGKIYCCRRCHIL